MDAIKQSTHSLILIILLLCFNNFTFANSINENPLTAKHINSPLKVSPGENKEIQIKLYLSPEFHAYIEQFKLTSPNKNLLISEPNISPVVDFYDKTSKKNRKGVYKEALLKTVVELDQNLTSLPDTLDLKFQACTETYCLLPKTVSIPIILDIPKSAYAKKQEPDKLTEALGKGFFYSLLFVFITGILTSFTPCIYPMIPITLAVIGNKQTNSKLQSLFVSLIYVFGIALTYSVLGLIAASTGSLFGSVLGHPISLVIISVIFFIMALSMFGLFEIKAPSFITNRIPSHKKISSNFDIFITGIVAGVIASPCVGPVLVGILTYVANTQDLFLGFILLFVFALGLGQIFIVLGVFSQLITKIPKSGNWMNFVKYIFATLLIGVSIYYFPFKQLGLFKTNPTVSVENSYWDTLTFEKLAKAKKAGKPIIIDFWATWCAACFELEENTFQQKDVKLLLDKFSRFKFDATDTNTEEMVQFTKMFDIKGLPHVVILDKNGNWKKELTLTGLESPEDFIKRIKPLL